MRKKILIIVLVIAIVGVVGIMILKSTKNIKVETQIAEYTPEEEISDEQLRQTIVTLYFQDSKTNELIPEARNVDVKLLVDNPYEELINMLLEGPKSSNLSKTIPEGTTLNNVELIDSVLVIDFSKEFVENCEDNIDKQSIIINSIVNTMLELKEVTSVKILIDGEENQKFSEEGIDFSENFVKD